MFRFRSLLKRRIVEVDLVLWSLTAFRGATRVVSRRMVRASLLVSLALLFLLTTNPGILSLHAAPPPTRYIWTLYASADTYITMCGGPNGLEPILAVSFGRCVDFDFHCYSLIQFKPADIASIPNDANIIEASLKLWLNRGDGFAIKAERITTPWDEYEVFWGFALDPPVETTERESAVLDVGTTSGVYSWDVTNIVQGWHRGDYNNHGLMIKQAKEEYGKAAGFNSRESPEPNPNLFYTTRPRLEVTFESSTPPPGPPKPPPIPQPDQEPPEIRIFMTPDSPGSSGDWVQIRAEASDNIGLGVLQLEIDGELIDRVTADPPDEPTLDILYGANFDFGRHIINARAWDQAWLSASATREFHVGVGDLYIVSVEPVQVVDGAPLVKGKGTVFRVRAHSTFADPVETHFKLTLPDGDWTKNVAPGRVLPETWGPVELNPGDNEIILPIDPPVRIIEVGCSSGTCRPDVRAAPRPRGFSTVTFAVEIDPWDEVSETDEDNNELDGSASVVTTKRFKILYTIHAGGKMPGHEDVLTHLDEDEGTARCPVDDWTRTLSEVCDDARVVAKDSTEYLLGVAPIADAKMQYAVDCTVRDEAGYYFVSDDLGYADYWGYALALAKSADDFDYVLSIEPCDDRGGCGVGSSICGIGGKGQPPNAAHELLSHGIQRFGQECYCCDGACPTCSDVACDSCVASEGFWVNRWINYDEGVWGSGSPTYYADGVGGVTERWQRLDNPWRHSDGSELPGGYLDLIDILEDVDDPEVLLARGTINRDGSGNLGPCMVLENGTVDIEAGEQGDYYLVLLDFQGRVLSKAGFDTSFDFMTAEGRVELERASFVYRIEWLELAKRIELQDKYGRVLASREVTPNKPEIEVLYPNGGEIFANGDKIKWQASDKDGDLLTFALSISMDGGQTWLPIDIDVMDREYELSTLSLEEGRSYLIKVRGTDGVNTGEDISDGAFTITKEKRRVIPDEKSIEQVVAEHSGNPNLVDDADILWAVQLWIRGEEVPGAGQTISDKKILELVELWITGSPVSSSASQTETEVEALAVKEIKFFPNPLGNMHPATFKVEGKGIAGMKVEIFNLAGMRVFEQEASGNTLEFHGIDNEGHRLANGIYLYVVTVRGFNGELVKSRVKKLIVLR